jgi:SsrA-binding protein
MAKKEKNKNVICQNRKTRHDYNILSTLEAGLVLSGTEVKSLRQGKGNITDAYAQIKNGEMFIVNLNISPYDKATHFNHEPRRERKLLLKKREIEKLTIKIKEKGFTLVPIDLHFKNGWIKATLALVKGKKQYDNRQEIAAKQFRREMRNNKKEEF